MAGAQPTLGYRSRTDAVLALRCQGLTTREIAERIGIEASTVVALEHSAARRRSDEKRQAHQQGRAILLPIEHWLRLEQLAAQRGVHPNRLARRIIETVIEDDLLDAVLDDDDGGKPKARA